MHESEQVWRRLLGWHLNGVGVGLCAENDKGCAASFANKSGKLVCSQHRRETIFKNCGKGAK
jgi:hypothetical protein